MKTVVRSFMWLVAMAAGSSIAQPPAGSRLPPDQNNCLTCHSEADLWEGDTLRLYVSREDVEHDVHFRAGVNCHDCHGGDPGSFDVPVAHSRAGEDQESGPRPFLSPLGEVVKSCVRCHEESWDTLKAGAHARVGDAAEGLSVVMRQCGGCHGEKAHGIRAVGDADSPVFSDKQVRLCGGCHEEALDEYRNSVHGDGLFKSGLLVTAVCADCHGAHAVYPADNENSTLYVANVADTCGACHRFIEERLQKSVHGGSGGPGRAAGNAAPGGEVCRGATCTDCHEGHGFTHPDSPRFRLSLPNRCGGCHAELSHQYALSIHGELTELGYAPAARCPDCHGDHDVLPVDDPASPLSSGRRLGTCQKCHPNAVANFLQFDPHADHRNPRRDPIVHGVWLVLMTLLISVFTFFGLHSVLWLVRSVTDVARNGRPRGLAPGRQAYVRFGSFHRVAHTLMMISFLGLALTGLPLKYSHYDWAKVLAYWMGGFASTSFWHRIFGVMTFAFPLAYLLRTAFLYRRPAKGGRGLKALFGPDSLLPCWRDVKDFAKMIRWFLGRGPRPTFERWAYWEKFDFWGATADVAIIGFTGLVLWFPNFFCAFLPGVTINIAKVIHSTQALLATGFVFAVHFFNAHVRAEKFPADMSVLTGLVSEEEMEHERPEYLARLRRDGRDEQLRAVVPSRKTLWTIRLAGYLAFAIGLALLAGMIVAPLAE